MFVVAFYLESWKLYSETEPFQRRFAYPDRSSILCRLVVGRLICRNDKWCGCGVSAGEWVRWKVDKLFENGKGVTGRWQKRQSPECSLSFWLLRKYNKAQPTSHTNITAENSDHNQPGLQLTVSHTHTHTHAHTPSLWATFHQNYQISVFVRRVWVISAKYLGIWFSYSKLCN